MVPVIPDNTYSRAEAMELCSRFQNIQNYSHVFTVDSAEKMTVVQNLIKLLNLTNQRYYWTSAIGGLYLKVTIYISYLGLGLGM